MSYRIIPIAIVPSDRAQLHARIATRQLAKRQLTWLRAMPDNIELDCLQADLAKKVLDKLAKNI